MVLTTLIGYKNFTIDKNGGECKKFAVYNKEAEYRNYTCI
jgi:hypothetical protein